MCKPVSSCILDVPGCVVIDQSLFNILKESERLLADERFVCHAKDNNAVVVDVVKLVVVSLCRFHRVLSHTLHQLDSISLEIALV